jgi:hypothetical protein
MITLHRAPRVLAREMAILIQRRANGNMIQRRGYGKSPPARGAGRERLASGGSHPSQLGLRSATCRPRSPRSSTPRRQLFPRAPAPARTPPSLRTGTRRSRRWRAGERESNEPDRDEAAGELVQQQPVVPRRLAVQLSRPGTSGPEAVQQLLDAQRPRRVAPQPALSRALESTCSRLPPCHDRCGPIRQRPDRPARRARAGLAAAGNYRRTKHPLPAPTGDAEMRLVPVSLEGDAYLIRKRGLAQVLHSSAAAAARFLREYRPDAVFWSSWLGASFFGSIHPPGRTEGSAAKKGPGGPGELAAESSGSSAAASHVEPTGHRGL